MSDRKLRWLLLLAGLTCVLLFAQPVGVVGAERRLQIPTSTPMEDGAIVHIVAEGEFLATIAESYGVSMNDIRSMNGMAPTSNLIFPGQRLIIRLAPTLTITPSITPATPRPTRTPTPVSPTRTPAPTSTPMPTFTPTATPNPVIAAATGFLGAYRQPLLISMIVVCAAGVVWTLWAGFRKK